MGTRTVVRSRGTPCMRYGRIMLRQECTSGAQRWPKPAQFPGLPRFAPCAAKLGPGAGAAASLSWFDELSITASAPDVRSENPPTLWKVKTAWQCRVAIGAVPTLSAPGKLPRVPTVLRCVGGGHLPVSSAPLLAAAVTPVAQQQHVTRGFTTQVARTV